MATWVEDIVQALKNLGGQAHFRQIIDEAKHIRKEPLPDALDNTIRELVQAHSSDSPNFQRQGLFIEIGNDIWALREVEDMLPLSNELMKRTKTRQDYHSKNEKIFATGEWVEVIIQAMKNLGGQASIADIYAEVKRLRPGPLPKLQDVIYRRSSDTTKFQGKDLFRKVGSGIWALREQEDVNP